MIRPLPPITVNGEAGVSELDQPMNAPPWSETAAASSRIESELPTPMVTGLEPTPVTVVGEPAPVVHPVEPLNSVLMRVNVTPLVAELTLMLPSVNVVWAVNPDVWPTAVSKKVTPRSLSWISKSEF